MSQAIYKQDYDSLRGMLRKDLLERVKDAVENLPEEKRELLNLTEKNLGQVQYINFVQYKMSNGRFKYTLIPGTSIVRSDDGLMRLYFEFMAVYKAIVFEGKIQPSASEVPKSAAEMQEMKDLLQTNGIFANIR